MSERNHVIESRTKIGSEKVEVEVVNEDNDDEEYERYGFKIKAKRLEEIVGYYKERGDNFQDLEFFKKENGVDNILRSLQTNEKIGILTFC